MNRATLARQFLLERTDAPPLDVTHHLAGLQAQTPHSWYVGFFSRITGFEPSAASELLESRQLVRIAAMRSTIHLLTGPDARGLRPLVQPVLDRGLRASFGKRLTGIDQDKVLAVTRQLFAGGEPLTFKQVGGRLAERWPDADAQALSMVARHRLPLVQVPPRGLWQTSGPIAHVPLDLWLGDEQAASYTAEELTRRYLAAFGPATVADLRMWSGLTKLTRVIASMADELLPLEGPGGEQLWDLADAPRPSGRTPAPVRFLYDYDNLLLSHRDRSRFITPEYTAQEFAKQATTPRLVLVDGRTAATWRDNVDDGRPSLAISALRPLSVRERKDIGREAEALGDFLHGDLGDVDIIFNDS